MNKIILSFFFFIVFTTQLTTANQRSDLAHFQNSLEKSEYQDASDLITQHYSCRDIKSCQQMQELLEKVSFEKALFDHPQIGKFVDKLLNNDTQAERILMLLQKKLEQDIQRINQEADNKITKAILGGIITATSSLLTGSVFALELLYCLCEGKFLPLPLNIGLFTSGITAISSGFYTKKQFTDYELLAKSRKDIQSTMEQLKLLKKKH